MLFSTKAEYGVRLMIELGRQPGSTPVSLNSVAEAERLRKAAWALSAQAPPSVSATTSVR